MVVLTKLIMIGIATVCALTLTFIVLEFVEDKVISKFSKKRNRVKFYVARDKNDELFLYMGKPFRSINKFHPYQNGCIITSDDDLSNFELNKDNYDNLKWEDEPIEVFLNLED